MAYIELNNLEIYRLSAELSELSWTIYKRLSFEHKKVMGDQFIRAIDSVGANIAEGYARYYYKDRVVYYRYSRASLSEGIEHWARLLFVRELISNEEYVVFRQKAKHLERMLNSFISTTLKNLEKKS